MKNNDILRRIRFIFDFDDSKMMALMSTTEQKVTRAQVSNFLKRDDDFDFQALSDKELAIFLNRLIEENRGKRDGPAVEPEKRLNNNMVFMKLKIALNLKAEDVLDILSVAGFKFGKHELSAFFRKPGHKHYRECKDQILRTFLQGLQLKHRQDIDTTEAKADSVTAKGKLSLKKDAASAKSAITKPPAYQWKKKSD